LLRSLPLAACQVRRSHTTKQTMTAAMIRIVVSIG
jgi:hypothetical protein